MQHILVPLDGSAVSEAVIPAVLSCAVPLGASITLLYVAVPTVDASLTYAAWGAMGEWTQDISPTPEELAERRTYLEAIKARMPEGLSVSCEVREGTLPDTILQVAQDVHADMIAMSTHGRGGLERLVLGSVTELVLRLSPVPVLVVHPRSRSGPSTS